MISPDFYANSPFLISQPCFNPKIHNPTNKQLATNFALSPPGSTKRQGKMFSSAILNRSVDQSPCFTSDPGAPIGVKNKKMASPSSATATVSAVKDQLDHRTDELNAEVQLEGEDESVDSPKSIDFRAASLRGADARKPLASVFDHAATRNHIIPLPKPSPNRCRKYKELWE
jgi:hypothetical protein